jgi:hypothetical protein
LLIGNAGGEFSVTGGAGWGSASSILPKSDIRARLNKPRNLMFRIGCPAAGRVSVPQNWDLAIYRERAMAVGRSEGCASWVGAHSGRTPPASREEHAGVSSIAGYKCISSHCRCPQDQPRPETLREVYIDAIVTGAPATAIY